MDGVVQKNTQNAAETASASEELKNYARQMNQVVNDIAKIVGSMDLDEDKAVIKNAKDDIVNDSSELGLAVNDGHTLEASSKQTTTLQGEDDFADF
jgi:hypothetical protein